MKKIIIVSTLILSGCMVVNKTFWLLRNNIAEHKWIVGNNVKDLPSNATIELSKNYKNSGKFKGFGGCNNYDGEYRVTNYYINFQLKNITKNSCPNIAKEKKFLSNILRTYRLYLKGGKLIFSTESHDKLMELYRMN